MTQFAKLRELVMLARNLEAEGQKLRPGSDARLARLIEADEYRAKAEWLVGRIDADEYNARLIECADARAYPID